MPTVGPFVSRLDLDARRLLEDHRRVTERDAADKLARLRLLQGRYIECNLPKEPETRVEQSFNEQLFAKVLGYSTLLSHDTLPFHLRPKASAGGMYNDFALGFFFGEKTDRVVVSAELKSPGVSLDKPQTDQKDKQTPVQQALRTARRFPECRWVIVCNFQELRLYDINDSVEPLAVVDLLEVRDRQQLAFLCAHFDRRALLGEDGNGDLMQALDPKHPSVPVEPAPDSYRLVITFTPHLELSTKLFLLHDALRGAAEKYLRMVKPHNPLHREEAWKDVTLDIREGWCVLRSAAGGATGEEPAAAYAVSATGQVRYSLRRVRREGRGQINPDLVFDALVDDLRTFIITTIRILGGVGLRNVYGPVSVSLREVKDWSLYVDSDLVRKDYHQNYGVCEDEYVTVGPFTWGAGLQPADVTAFLLSEIGLYFMSPDGDRFRFDDAKLVEQLTPTFVRKD